MVALLLFGFIINQLTDASQAMESEFAALGEILRQSNSPVRVAKYRADTDRDYCEETFGLKSFPTIVLLSSWRKM